MKDLPHEYTNLYYHSNLRQHFVFLRKFSKAFKKVGNVKQIYRTLPQGQAVHQIMISFISLDLWLCYDYVKLEMDRVMDGHNPMIYYPYSSDLVWGTIFVLMYRDLLKNKIH